MFVSKPRISPAIGLFALMLFFESQGLPAPPDSSCSPCTFAKVGLFDTKVLLDYPTNPVHAAALAQLFGFGIGVRHTLLAADPEPLCLDWVDYSPGEAEFHNRVVEKTPPPWVQLPVATNALHDSRAATFAGPSFSFFSSPGHQ